MKFIQRTNPWVDNCPAYIEKDGSLTALNGKCWNTQSIFFCRVKERSPRKVGLEPGLVFSGFPSYHEPPILVLITGWHAICDGLATTRAKQAGLMSFISVPVDLWWWIGTPQLRHSHPVSDENEEMDPVVVLDEV